MKNIASIIVIIGSALVLQSFIKTRSVIYVYADPYERVFVGDEEVLLDELCDTLKLMIGNNDRSPLFPEKTSQTVDYFGEVLVSRAVVSIASGRATSYKFYIQVYNEIELAYNQLRDELAIQQFEMKYKQLPLKKKKAVDSIISKNYFRGRNKVLVFIRMLYCYRLAGCFKVCL